MSIGVPSSPHPETNGSTVLPELIKFLTVHEFKSEEPDLEEIFIKAVRDASDQH